VAEIAIYTVILLFVAIMVMVALSPFFLSSQISQREEKDQVVEYQEPELQA